MRCEKSKRLISNGLDGPLKGTEWVRLDAHLASCVDCRAYRASLEALQTASMAIAPPVPEPEHAARSLARLKAGLREAAAGGLVPGSRPVPAPFARPKWVWAGASAVLLFAAASLFLVVFRTGSVAETVPYAFSDARSGLALSLAEDEDLALAFDSAIRAALVENSGAAREAVEPLAADTGLFLASLSDEEILILEAAIQEWTAL